MDVSHLEGLGQRDTIFLPHFCRIKHSSLRRYCTWKRSVVPRVLTAYASASVSAVDRRGRACPTPPTRCSTGCGEGTARLHPAPGGWSTSCLGPELRARCQPVIHHVDGFVPAGKLSNGDVSLSRRSTVLVEVRSQLGVGVQVYQLALRVPQVLQGAGSCPELAVTLGNGTDTPPVIGVAAERGGRRAQDPAGWPGTSRGNPPYSGETR